MSADGKWIPGLTPTTSLAEAARRTLQLRLELVTRHLPAAVERWHEDIEHVHQLRVATRRAGAAFDLFRDCLPHKRWKKGRRLLRDLRRAAGEARDWDVFGDMVLSAKPLQQRNAKPALDFLFGYALGQRFAAQTRLSEIGTQQREALDELCLGMVHQVEQPGGGRKHETLGELADRHLSERWAAFEAAASELPSDPAALHQIRILGKRLRYAMEIFADCYQPLFRDQLYPRIAEVQEILGNIQDSAVIVERLQLLGDRVQQHQEEWERLQFGIEKWANWHRKRIPAERERFVAWWQTWQQQLQQTPWPTLRLSGYVAAS